ncbi:MAG: hypothetical protein EPO06_03925 [Burkholderiaceae bacterium]|nr:MAG: hypothetical protein EPO06_03925 [Burkholderiaceae bacterium]
MQRHPEPLRLIQLVSRRFLFSSLAIAVLLGALLWRLFAQGIPLETNLLRLLPATEINPVAEQAVAQLTQAVGDRVLFLVGAPQRVDGTSDAVAAARQFGQALAQHPVFQSVRVDLPPLKAEQLRAPFLAARFNLLSDADRNDLARDPQHALAQRLQERLALFSGPGLGLSLEDDPFDYFGRTLTALPWQHTRLTPQEGVLQVQEGGQTWVLVLAELHGSAFTEAVQDQALAAVAHAEQQLAQTMPVAQLLRTGVLFYAQTARISAQQDVDRIGTVSAVGVVLLLLLAFRSPLPILLTSMSVAIGLGVALLVTVWWFGSLHLLTLVFGASLIGEAVDYAIQVCSIHAGTTTTSGNVARWHAHTVLRPLWPGLTIALATSVLGYFVLFLTPFPALKQMALFASSGLIAAFLVVRFWLPAGLRQESGRAAQTIAVCQRVLRRLQQSATPRRAIGLWSILLLLALPGWWLVQADDDVRQLSTRSPALLAQEQHLRALVGQESENRFFLVEAATEQDLLEREESLRTALVPLLMKNQIGSVQALSAFVPSQKRQQENYQRLVQAGMNDTKKLTVLLEQNGFSSNVAPRLQKAFAQEQKPLYLSDWLASPLSTPVRHLWLGKTARGFASIVMPKDTQPQALSALTALHLPGVQWVDKTASVSRLFAFYRSAGMVGLALMVAMLTLVLAWRYGWAGSVRVLLPTVIALLTAPAMLGYAHLPLTLFSVLALFLVLGVGVNYSIFLLEGARLARAKGMENHAYGGANFLGVLLSSTTTMLSFGLLAFSSMPVLRQFGLVLAAGILLALLLAPTTLAWEPRRYEGDGA